MTDEIEHPTDYASLAEIIQQSSQVVCGPTGGPYAVVPGDALRTALENAGGAPIHVSGKPIQYACGWRRDENDEPVKVGEWGKS